MRNRGPTVSALDDILVSCLCVFDVGQNREDSRFSAVLHGYVDKIVNDYAFLLWRENGAAGEGLL